MRNYHSDYELSIGYSDECKASERHSKATGIGMNARELMTSGNLRISCSCWNEDSGMSDEESGIQPIYPEFLIEVID